MTLLCAPSAPKASSITIALLSVIHVSLLGVCESVFTRKSHLDMTEDDWASLRKGFEVLRKRADDNATSYTWQANIHGYSNKSEDKDRADKNHWHQCQHGHYFFLPWHRMYLYWFEKILRKASGNPNLTIPYWDYFNEKEGGRKFPPQFLGKLTEDSQPNWLYVEGRCMTSPEIPQNYVDVGPALSKFRFTGDVQGNDEQKAHAICHSFGGRNLTRGNSFDTNEYGALERIPHNKVHNWIGGLMADNCRASQDPIFWLHHAQIDRVWDTWIKTHGQNPMEQAWLNQKFTFYNEDGEEEGMSVQSVLNTEEQLNYTYDKLVIEDVKDERGFLRRCVVVLGDVDVLAMSSNVTHEVTAMNPVIRLHSSHSPNEHSTNYSYSIQLTLVSILHTTMFRVCFGADSCTHFVDNFVISDSNCSSGQSESTLTFSDSIVKCLNATEAIVNYFSVNRKTSVPETIDIWIEPDDRGPKLPNTCNDSKQSLATYPTTLVLMRVSGAQLVRFTEGHGNHPIDDNANKNLKFRRLDWVHVVLIVGVAAMVIGCVFYIVMMIIVRRKRQAKGETALRVASSLLPAINQH